MKDLAKRTPNRGAVPPHPAHRCDGTLSSVAGARGQRATISRARGLPFRCRRNPAVGGMALLSGDMFGYCKDTPESVREVGVSNVLLLQGFFSRFLAQ